MDEALNRLVAEELRARGFTGSLPHFRRRDDQRISLISFQHFSSGGSFVAEVATCSPTGYTTSWGKEIPPTKVTAVDINEPRPRLGSPQFPEFGDHWFVYGARSYEPGGQTVERQEHYESVAAEVCRLLDDEAEPFWQSASA